MLLLNFPGAYAILSPSMPLSSEQQEKIKQTLGNYRKKVKHILSEHREKVLGAVANLDKKKTDTLRERIKKA
jgi:uncharacterized membrane protein